VQIAQAARRHRLALVHDPTGVVPLAFTHARCVATIHDVIPYVYPHTSTTLDWLIYRFWLPFAVRCLDMIITDSQQSKTDIVRHLLVKPEKVVVVPLAANPHYCLCQEETVQIVIARHKITTPYILYVGALEARKNLPRLLEAYAQLLQWSANWKLVVVGARKWKYSPIFETVMRLGLENHMHFMGFVPEDDLPALYNGADLFAFPSLYEGFGLPVLEAMACGTPVITSNVSSLPEVAGNAALLVDPYNVDELADAMRRILSAPALVADLRARGLERARQFSWERTAQETLAVYKHILENL
jgi:glycosyltransferase involved in cell wall biosynthesis